MISVASTLLLVSLVFGTSVPSAWAAPVGTRNLNVKSMRHIDTRELTGMRREHHSATSVVPRDDYVPVPVVARAGAPEVVPSDPATTAETSKPKMRRHHAKNEKSPDAKPRAMPRFKRDAVPRREREVVARKEDATSSNVAREDEKVEPNLPNGTATPGGAGKSDSGKRDVHDRTVASPRVPVTHEGGDAKSGPTKRDVPVVKPAESSPPKVAARHHHDGQGGPKKDCGKQEPPTPTQTPDPTATNTETKREEKLIKPIAIFRRALAFEDLD